MTSVDWTLLVISLVFLLVGLYFLFGRNAIVASTKARREQVNKIRPKNRQLPPSTLGPRAVAAGGIALSVVGVLLLVSFIVSLFR